MSPALLALTDPGLDTLPIFKVRTTPPALEAPSLAQIQVTLDQLEARLRPAPVAPPAQAVRESHLEADVLAAMDRLAETTDGLGLIRLAPRLDLEASTPPALDPVVEPRPVAVASPRPLPTPRRPREGSLGQFLRLGSLGLALALGSAYGLVQLNHRAPTPSRTSTATYLPFRQEPRPGSTLQEYLLRAEAGDVVAMRLLALCYRDGLDTAEDPVEASRWTLRALQAQR